MQYIERFAREKIERAMLDENPFLVYGAPSAGKTTLIQKILEDHEDWKYVSLDEEELRKFALSNEERIVNILKNGRFFLDSAHLAPGVVKKILSEKLNVCVISSIYYEGFDTSIEIPNISRREKLGSSRNVSFSADSDSCIKNMNDLESITSDEVWEEVVTGNPFRSIDEENFENRLIEVFGILRSRREKYEILLFLKNLAYQITCPVNYAELARQSNISDQSAKEWVQGFAKIGIIEILPGLETISRAVKKKRIYFRDSGFAARLLGEDAEKYKNELFETMVVSEIIKSKINSDEDINLCYIKKGETRYGSIPLAIEKHGKFQFIGFNSGSDPAGCDIRTLESYAQLIKPEAQAIIYNGNRLASAGTNDKNIRKKLLIPAWSVT